jgi:hypothetical protein
MYNNDMSYHMFYWMMMNRTPTPQRPLSKGDKWFLAALATAVALFVAALIYLLP